MINWIIVGLVLILCFVLIGVCLKMDQGKENVSEFEEIEKDHRVRW